MKKNTTSSLKFYGVLGVVVLAIVFSVTSIALAQVTGFSWANVEQLVAEKIFGNIESPIEEPSFGVGNDLIGKPTRFPNGYIDANFGFYVNGDPVVSSSTAILTEYGFAVGTVSTAGVVTDGYRQGHANVDLTNTSSAVLLNPEGRSIFVYDATLRIQTATTTANIAYLMGTSTSSGLDQGQLCGFTGVCATAAGGGEASILNTAAITAAANATYFKADYQGTDTRDGSGTWFNPIVRGDEYLFCGVSTTAVANGQTGGQAAQCQFKYYVIED